MDPKDKDEALVSNSELESSSISALLLLDREEQTKAIQKLLPNFSSPLKNEFENRNLWLRFGLALSLTRTSPHDAIQAFNECLRIDPQDPLPAILAAKIYLKDLDQPNEGLQVIKDAIERCESQLPEKHIKPNGEPNNNHQQLDQDSDQEPTTLQMTDSIVTNGVLDSDVGGEQPANCNQSDGNTKRQDSIVEETQDVPVHGTNQILATCYLLASVMNARIYERESESIRQYKSKHLKASLEYLDLAQKYDPQNHLVYFHKALHDARQRSFASAIDNVKKAIELNSYHAPSIQLMVLSLSALKMYDEALTLCESALYEFENDILLLYIKCNLEQRLVETRGFKSALNTAEYILNCIKTKSIDSKNSEQGSNTSNSTISRQHSLQNSIQQSQPQPPAPPSIIVEPVAKQLNAVNLFASENTDQRRLSGEFSADELSAWLLVAEIFVRIGSVSYMSNSDVILYNVHSSQEANENYVTVQINDAERCVDEGSMHTDGALSYQIMYTRGLIAKAKSNLNEAKNFLQNCLALCPRHANGLQQLAHVHYLLGNYPTAEKFLRDSLDFDNDCHKTWYYLSLVYIETNQHDKANECVKKANALEDSSPIIPISAIPRLTLE